MSERQSPSRFAVFVDAGYLLAAGAWATVGSYKRVDARVAVAELTTWLRQEAEADAGGRELLRLYWYDASPRREPTSEHREVAMQTDTKLRLGSLNAYNQQKGVDALLLTDMIDLAGTHSIDLAYLVSGDEDLVEAVRRIQAVGVRLILWGVDTPKNTVSVELRNEADRWRMLTSADLRAFFESAALATPASAPAPTPTARPTWTSLPHLGPEVPPSTQPPPVTYADVDIEAAEEAGRRFGQAWVEQATAEDRDLLRRGRPQIPPHVDGRLLTQACRELRVSADEQLDFDARVALRRGFWDAISSGAQ